MNRQEAYKYLADYIDHNYDPDRDYAEFCWAMECVNRLAPSEPDPDTGLMPCGCGWALRLDRGEREDEPERKCDCSVVCSNPDCGWQMWDTLTRDEIVFRANRAMGWKEEKE